MRTWKVYEKEGAEPEAVKVGFNYLAFVFPLFWSFVQRLFKQWFYGLMFLIVSAFVWMMVVLILEINGYLPTSTFYAAEAVNYLQVLLGYVYGRKCNEWYRNYLNEEGYQLSLTIEAENAKGAIERYKVSKQA